MDNTKRKEFLPYGTWKDMDKINEDKKIIVHNEPFTGTDYKDEQYYPACLSPSYVSEDFESLPMVTTRYIRTSIDEETGVQNYYAEIFVIDAETDGFIITVVPSYIPDEIDIVEGDSLDDHFYKHEELFHRMEWEVTIHSGGNRYMLFLGGNNLEEIGRAVSDAEANVSEIYESNYYGNLERKHKKTIEGDLKMIA